MRFNLGSKTYQMDRQVVLITLACLAWSVYYYFNTVAQPDEGPESVLFIEPLVIALLVVGLFVLFSSIKAVPPGEASEEKAAKDPGLLHPRRLVFAISLFGYAAILPHLGYLIPSLAYLCVMCFYFGLRRWWLYAALSAAYTLLLWWGFKTMMEVPIPVLPPFMQ